MATRLAGATFLCATLLVAEVARADPIMFFRVVPLIQGEATGINERGAVTVNTPDGPSLVDGQRIVRIHGASLATAVNDRDEVTGQSTTLHPYRWANGVLQPLVAQAGIGYDINNHGVVAGEEGGGPRATIWRNGLSRPIVSKEQISTASGINNRGEVVGGIFDPALGFEGNRAFIWSDAAGLQLLGANSFALDINDGGVVVGQAFSAAGGEVGFWFDPLRGFSNFELPPAAVGLLPLAVNDANWIVGNVLVPSDDEERIPIPRGFVSIGFGRPLFLDDLTTLEEGWRIAGASDVNNRGQIAAIAVHPFRGTMAVRLDPVEPIPEPATILLLAPFAAGVVARARRRRQNGRDL
jgi:hypothetical protein